MDEIENIFTERLYSKAIYDECWEFLHRYFEVFKKEAFQNVIVTLNSHWDWYIRNLANFIEFARGHIASPELSNKENKQFTRIGNCSISQQLEIIEMVSGVKLDIEDEDLERLREMSRVRNLGLHNRWEVDVEYLELSGREDTEVGEIRVVEIDEINQWHSSLLKTLHVSCKKVAIQYVSAPAFP